MTYEAFKKELYKHVAKQAKAGGRLARLLEKGSVCEDTQLLQAVRIVNLNESSHMRHNGLDEGTVFGADETGIHEDMLLVVSEGLGMSSVMHWKIRPLYERFKREGWQSVLPGIVMKLQKAGKPGVQTAYDRTSYEGSADRLIVRPLNFDYHREELENCVYWRFDDIALVLYSVIYDMDPDFMTMKLTKGMLEKWNVTGTEALTGALLNTCERMPPRLYHGTDVFYTCDSCAGSFMQEECKTIQINPEDADEGVRGYRLTTTRWLNGAAALFYPGVKERLAELFGGDYYVGFASIHEAVLHPVRHKILGEMKGAVQHTNAVFDQREMLTNRVYRYCCARGALVEV